MENFFYKNYFFYDYTINTEFYIFTDLSLLDKQHASDDFNLLPSYKTYINLPFEVTDDFYFFNYLPFSENFYWNQKIDLNFFLFLKTSSFISFFVNLNIDVPTCFKKSKSLSFKTFELPFIKFFNLIMRHGRRDQSIRLFFKKILNRFNLWQDTPKYQINENNQKILLNSIYFFENYRNIEKFDSFLKSKKYLSMFTILSSFEKNNLQKSFSFPLFSRLKTFEHKPSLFFKNSFLKPFTDVNPVFAYFIYNVDKNIKKYSRGKSGKYAFVWKYITPYKRLFLTMRLFAKELKFRKERKFFERFLGGVSSLENDFDNSFIWQFKVFSHNYVFKNFKKLYLLI